jgi:hypothetical protein
MVPAGFCSVEVDYQDYGGNWARGRIAGIERGCRWSFLGLAQAPFPR